MEIYEINGNGYTIRLTCQVEQDVAGNKSVVRVTKLEMKAETEVPGIAVYLLGAVFVNGAEAASMSIGATYGCDAVLSQSYFGGGEEGPGGWSVGFTASNVTVDHEEDGTAQIDLAATVHLYHNQSKLDTIYGNGTVQLPQIPRTSALTAAGVDLGQEMVIGLTRAPGDFVDTVTWRCGEKSGILAEKTSEQELRWTVPLDLATEAPEDSNVAVVFTVTTFLGETKAGSQDTEVICTIPMDLVADVSVELTDRMGYTSQFGGYIQSQSQVNVVTQAQGRYGASIREINVKCGKLSGTGEEVCFALEDSGVVSITVTVEDSRGRTVLLKTTITVLPYQKPWVTLREAARCDEAGNHQPDGAWLKLVFDAGVTDLSGKNTAQYQGMCTVHGGEDTRQVTLSDYANQLTVTGGMMLISAGVDTGYDCRIAVQDSFCTVESGVALVSVAFALMDFCRGTKAVGIGMRAINEGMLSIGMDTDMAEHRVGNLAAPENDTDAATKGYVDACIRQLREQLGMG